MIEKNFQAYIAGALKYSHLVIEWWAWSVFDVLSKCCRSMSFLFFQISLEKNWHSGHGWSLHVVWQQRFWVEVIQRWLHMIFFPWRMVKGEVRRKMNFTYVLGFVVLRDVVKVFPVSSSSFARKKTGRNRARSHSGAWRGLKTKWDLKLSLPSPTYLVRYLFV